MRDFGGLECFWSDLSKHPVCSHGPTLLFGRNEGDEFKQFYACSACRDRKLCPFYAEKDAKSIEGPSKGRNAVATNTIPFYNHRKLFVRFNETMVQSPERRAYCYSCDKVIPFSERKLHSDHELRTNLSDEEMNNPTTILPPLADVKKEAQYLFSKKATIEITNMLIKAGAKQVLCIGAPRIHEYITQNLENQMSSLLLDFDGRFHNFFGPLSYCWYNLFNHHFFTQEGAQTYRDFMTQNGGEGTFLICDPPFGGRVEAISQTIETIVDQHKKWNCLEVPSLGIFFIFPYFMESIMQRKSNPPGQEGGLKSLKMSDYKVDYENHPLFLSGLGGRKHGSPVRIFTNIALKTLELPSESGYRYCIKCEKWVASENRHCKKCGDCTSKDGRSYKHCERCQRCVKPTWNHCDTCDRCTLDSHKCGEKPRVTGRCHMCGGKDHIAKDCNKRDDAMSTKKLNKKRTKKPDENAVPKKKKKSSTSETSVSAPIRLLESTKTLNKNRTKKPKENAFLETTKSSTSETPISAPIRLLEPTKRLNKKRTKKPNENTFRKKKKISSTSETPISTPVRELKNKNGTKKTVTVSTKRIKTDVTESNECSEQSEATVPIVKKAVTNRKMKNKTKSLVKKKLK